MKNKLLIAAIVCSTTLINSNLCAHAADTEVSNYTDLNSAVNNAATTSINIKSDITTTSNINDQTPNTLTIKGNYFTLDGNKALPTDAHGQYTGFNIIAGKTLTLREAILKNFYKNTQGSAINNAGTVNIYNSTFTDGLTNTYGAGIYNNGTANIYSSTFTNNTSTSGGAGGGAIYNASGNTANIYNSTFKNNTARTGGAVCNSAANMSIYNSIFEGNSARSGSAVFGGGITNIYNSTFLNNTTTANGSGGAIYSDVTRTSTIYNSTFTNNTALVDGGAIYNSVGVVNLIANGGYVKFTGNTDSTGSNAIYSFSGTTNLNAGFGDIVFNDKIRSNGTTSNIINVNMTGTSTSLITPDNNKLISSAPTSGRILLNNAIVGFNMNGDAINLFNTGTLKLGSYTDAQNNTSYGSIGTGNLNRITNFNMYNNSIFDLTNGHADDKVWINTFKPVDTPHLWLDIDIIGDASHDSDKLDIVIVGGLGHGVLSVKTFRMLNDAPDDTPVPISIFSNEYLPNAVLEVADTYTNDYGYTVTRDYGVLTFTQVTPIAGAGQGIRDALNATGERSFSLLGNYTAGTDLPSLTAGELTIFGKNKDYFISGANLRSLFNIAAGAKLNMFDTVVKQGLKATGGAMYNLGTANIYDSSFSNNIAGGSGGAILNAGTANIYNTAFSGNASNGGNGGGAICTQNIANIYNSSFTGNSSSGAGGAIYNTSTLNIYNSSFTNNTSTGNGGAIFHNAGAGSFNIIADGGNVEFTGNKQNYNSGTGVGTSNAIFSAAGSVPINLNAGNGQIIFNDRIASTGNGNIININKTLASNAPTQGTIVLNEDMTGYGNNSGATNNRLYMYGGTLKLGENGTFFEKVNFEMYAGSTLDFQNAKIDDIKLQNVMLINDGTSFLKIDADLLNETADNFMGTTFDIYANGTVLNIKDINILKDAANSSATKIQMTSEPGIQQAIVLDDSQKSVMGPVYNYDVSYDKSNGMLSFEGGGSSYTGYNPATFSAGVAAQTGGYLGALATYNEVLNRIDQPILDNIMIQSQIGYDPKFLNKTASAAGQPEFSPLMDSTKEAAGWFRPFSTFEKIPLNNGPKVSNIAYGGIIGVDSNLKELGRGYQGVVTAYGGYTGSHQKYDGVSLFQNGGYGGLMGTLYKGDFFSALTANAGGSQIASNNSPNFGVFNTGLSSRTGYNFRMLNNKLILQPNYMMSYTFVKTQDYTNNQGVNISTNALNAMQIVPGIKLIANLNHGWQPYLSANMVFNLLDKSKVAANEVALPEVSVDPYVEYGAGVQKKWGERFTGFFQTMIRNGGRNGVSLLAGLKWTI